MPGRHSGPALTRAAVMAAAVCTLAACDLHDTLRRGSSAVARGDTSSIVELVDWYFGDRCDGAPSRLLPLAPEYFAAVNAWPVEWSADPGLQLEARAFTVGATTYSWSSGTYRGSTGHIARLRISLTVRAAADAPLGDRRIRLHFPRSGLLRGGPAMPIACVKPAEVYEPNRVAMADPETFVVSVKVIEGTLVERGARAAVWVLLIALGAALVLVLGIVVVESIRDAIRKRRARA